MATHRVEADGSIRLIAFRNVTIPELGFALIPHGFSWTRLSPSGALYLLMREPGIFLERQLLIDQGPVLDGEIVTTVFNLSAKRQLIRRGECISRLIPFA